MTVYSVFTSRKAATELTDLYNKKYHVQEVYMTLRNADRAQRYYLLTGERSYLNKFNDNEKLLATFDKDPLSLLIDKKLNEMHRTIALKEKGDQINLIKLVLSKEGQQYMDEIEEYVGSTLKELNVQEHNLLIASSRWHSGGLASSTLLSLTSCVLFIIVLYRTRK
jgi:CHASE3 domain sensor protein